MKGRGGQLATGEFRFGVELAHDAFISSAWFKAPSSRGASKASGHSFIPTARGAAAAALARRSSPAAWPSSARSSAGSAGLTTCATNPARRVLRRSSSRASRHGHQQRRLRRLPQAASRFVAVHAGQGELHQHDVGAEGGRRREGLRPVGGRFGLAAPDSQEHAQAVARIVVVVHDQHAQRVGRLKRGLSHVRLLGRGDGRAAGRKRYDPLNGTDHGSWRAARNALSVDGAKRDGSTPRKTKKPTWRNAPAAFNHVGLLIDRPPGAAGLLFLKSSDVFEEYIPQGMGNQVNSEKSRRLAPFLATGIQPRRGGGE